MHNWVRAIVASINMLPTREFVLAINNLINRKIDPDKKSRALLGFGPSDFFDVARRRLHEVEEPADYFAPVNPFINLDLDQGAMERYLSSGDELCRKQHVIGNTALFVKIGHELFGELSRVLRRNNFSVENTYIALESVKFSTFKTGVIPFITSNAETLRRLNLLSDDLWAMYQEFRRLLHYFKDTMLDQRDKRKVKLHRKSTSLVALSTRESGTKRTHTAFRGMTQHRQLATTG